MNIILILILYVIMRVEDSRNSFLLLYILGCLDRYQLPGGMHVPMYGTALGSVSFGRGSSIGVGGTNPLSGVVVPRIAHCHISKRLL